MRDNIIIISLIYTKTMPAESCVGAHRIPQGRALQPPEQFDSAEREQGGANRPTNQQARAHRGVIEAILVTAKYPRIYTANHGTREQCIHEHAEAERDRGYQHLGWVWWAASPPLVGAAVFVGVGFVNHRSMENAPRAGDRH